MRKRLTFLLAASFLLLNGAELSARPDPWPSLFEDGARRSASRLIVLARNGGGNNDQQQQQQARPAPQVNQRQQQHFNRVQRVAPVQFRGGGQQPQHHGGRQVGQPSRGHIGSPGTVQAPTFSGAFQRPTGQMTPQVGTAPAASARRLQIEPAGQHRPSGQTQPIFHGQAPSNANRIQLTPSAANAGSQLGSIPEPAKNSGRLQLTPQSDAARVPAVRPVIDSSNHRHPHSLSPASQAEKRLGSPVSPRPADSRPAATGRLQLEPTTFVRPTADHRNVAPSTSSRPGIAAAGAAPVRLSPNTAATNSAPAASAPVPVTSGPGAKAAVPSVARRNEAGRAPNKPLAGAPTAPVQAATFSKPDQNLKFNIPPEGQVFRAVGDDMRLTLYVVKGGQLQSIGGEKYVANTDLLGPNGQIIKAGQEAPTNRLYEAGYRPVYPSFTGTWTSTTRAGALYDRQHGTGSYERLPTYNVADVNTAVQKISQQGGSYPGAGQTFVVKEDPSIKGYTNPNAALQVPTAATKPAPQNPILLSSPSASHPTEKNASAPVVSQPTYIFARNASGLVEIYQNGQRISTTTPQQAELLYGYKASASTPQPAGPTVPIYPVGMAPASPSNPQLPLSNQQRADKLRQELLAAGVPQAEVNRTIQAYYVGTGSGPTSPTTQLGQVNAPTRKIAATTEQTPKAGIGSRFVEGVGYVLPSVKGFGESIAAAVGAPWYQSKLDAIQKADNDYLTLVIQRRNAAIAAGQDTSHWDTILRNYQPTLNSALTTAQVFPSVNKSTGQLAGEALGTALDLTSGSALKVGGQGLRAASLSRDATVVPKLLNPPIRILDGGLQHVMERHSINSIQRWATKSKFNNNEDIPSLIRQTTQSPMTLQSNGNYSRMFDFGRVIGFDGYSKKPTSIIKVITRADGSLVTAYPVLP